MVLQPRERARERERERECVCVFVGALSWRSSKDPIVCNFHSNPHHPLSQTVQDFELIFLIHCDSRWYKFFMNYPARIDKKIMTIVLIFIFAHESLLVSWRLWRVPILALPLGFRVIFEKPTFVTCYDPIRNIWFSFEQFKRFCRHFISTGLFIIIQIFRNHHRTQFPHIQILR
jgi:hypothetical protein